MTEIIGTISSNYKFSACNNAYSSEKLKEPSPVMINLPHSSNLRASLTIRPSAGSEMYGVQKGFHVKAAAASAVEMRIGMKKPIKWWEKGVKQNMKDVRGAEDLVDSLLNAGNKLVVVEFFSPGCGGCRALHPKICQLAEMNPEVQFLQVNYEEHRSMCYSLGVHVLPFFRFYRGAQGRVCSFSCTNATVKKFRDALAKHTPDRSSLGPPKGLEEKQLLALGSNRDLSFTYPLNPNHPKKIAPEPLPRPLKMGDRTLVSSAQ